MSSRRGVRGLPFLSWVFVVFLVANTLYFAVGVAANPSGRVSPFGLGLPAEMRTTTLDSPGLSMKFPEGWISLSIAHGDHGDPETIHSFAVPWHSLPRVTVARKEVTSAQLLEVAAWGEGRARRKLAYRELVLSELETGSYPALVREYDYAVDTLVGNKRIHCEDLYFLRESAAYDISFCAEESEWQMVKATFDEMMTSVRFGER